MWFSSRSSKLITVDVVEQLITIYSYRLGVLGFPGVAIPEKNLGLLDQRAAVEWIRDKYAFSSIVDPIGC